MPSVEISEVVSQVTLAEHDPHAFFGSDVDGKLKELQAKYHPDKFRTDDDRLSADELFRRFGLAADKAKQPPVTIVTKKSSYVLGKQVAVGDVSDVYESGEYVLKVSRIPGAEPLLAKEWDTLSTLHKNLDPNYARYLPKIVDTVKCKDTISKRVNVFEKRPAINPPFMQVSTTLESLRERQQAAGVQPLGGRHLAWLFKRLLEILGAVHNQGVVHNAILPSHILIFPADHGIQLLDWKVASAPGKLGLVSAKYQSWYPAEVAKKEMCFYGSDLYMAAQCMVFAAGGDPSTKSVPDSVPRPMSGFFQSCLMEKNSMRPSDAWALRDEFSEMLLKLYGKPRFVPLEI